LPPLPTPHRAYQLAAASITLYRPANGNLILALQRHHRTWGNGDEKLDWEFMQQTPDLLKRKAALDEAAQ
jgi:hypothetical protein